ncbi:uncharacterized protein LOC142587220 isoform X2 [Dermacentor variabilis]
MMRLLIVLAASPDLMALLLTETTMRFLTVLAASPALMALLLTELSGITVEDNGLDPACKTPTKPFFDDINSLNLTILYIYNETSGLCVDVLIDKDRNNTFDSRFKCVSLCKTGQGAEFCVGNPVNKCEKRNSTKTVSTTDSSGRSSDGLSLRSEDRVDEGSFYDSINYDDYEEHDDRFTAYFYNVTSESCQEYLVCGEPNRSLATNYFLSDTYCEYECGGFNASNICGTKKPEN